MGGAGSTDGREILVVKPERKRPLGRPVDGKIILE
jgi:hypothetical protein